MSNALVTCRFRTSSCDQRHLDWLSVIGRLVLLDGFNLGLLLVFRFHELGGSEQRNEIRRRLEERRRENSLGSVDDFLLKRLL